MAPCNPHLLADHLTDHALGSASAFRVLLGEPVGLCNRCIFCRGFLSALCDRRSPAGVGRRLGLVQHLEPARERIDLLLGRDRRLVRWFARLAVASGAGFDFSTIW